ncbi:MAG: hypothetical protein HY897_11295, partial [Deltaproteobacteria bacterium]|nr:hypothetical protein [Deltaproteobacteria bacterium]
MKRFITASFVFVVLFLVFAMQGCASGEKGPGGGEGADACADCAGKDGGGTTDGGSVADGGGPTDGGGTTDGGSVADGGGGDDGGGATDGGGAGCMTIDECGAGMFCRKADGECTGVGECDLRPADDCGGLDETVCGCDGENYGSPCWANSYGVNIRSAGQCPASTACSGEGPNGGCPEDSFCRTINETCGGGGYCTLVPLECPDMDYPVCACDDKTYASRCHAEMAAQSVLHQGECGSMNSCARNDECAPEEFCAKPAGACSESTPGKCDRRPDDCFMTRAVAPQCGCDDYTYSNECWAAAAGTVIAHAGECDGDVLCWNNDACGAGEFCQRRTGVCDMGFGVCRPKPADCPAPEEPARVCGCDLETYGDECTAWLSDTSVKHFGECTGPDDSLVRYFYADNAESADGYLRIVLAPDDIREFWSSEVFTEALHDQNQMTLTIRFYASALPEADYAELQFTLSLPPLTPYGIGLGYNGSYL